MMHELTQRVKGLLGDTCNSCCCIDQNICVGINCLPTHSLFLSKYCVMLLNINFVCTLQNRWLCSEYEVSTAIS